MWLYNEARGQLFNELNPTGGMIKQPQQAFSTCTRDLKKKKQVTHQK
jgi:hypothetical protein